MAVEIERKFLVDSFKLRLPDTGHRICQGYMPSQGPAGVRVRILDDKGFLTIKGPTQGMSRQEFEYEIPLADAESLLEQFCIRPFIDKTRYLVNHGNHVFEVDIFHQENEGLIFAEVELSSEEEAVELPDWIKEEITSDWRYSNSSLVKRPYNTW